MRFLYMKNTNTLKEVTYLYRNCLDAISSNMQNIKEISNNLPKTLNRPEVSISDKTYQSIKLLDWSLNQLRNVSHNGDFNVDLLSCMNLNTCIQ